MKPFNDPTVGGGVLALVNSATTETATITLPASGWQGIGTPAGSRGYKYSDRSHANGPCTKIVVTSAKLWAQCSGAGLGFSLDEATQGSLGVRVGTGTGGLLRCLLFGGSVRKDAPGAFLALKAPAPTACP